MWVKLDFSEFLDIILKFYNFKFYRRKKKCFKQGGNMTFSRIFKAQLKFNFPLLKFCGIIIFV